MIIKNRIEKVNIIKEVNLFYFDEWVWFSLLMLIIINYTLNYNVHVKNSIIPGHPPIYWFSNTTNDESYYIKLNERPIVSMARKVDLVWHQVFK